jgi:hypothetical protein
VNAEEYDRTFGFTVRDYFEDDDGNPLDEIGLYQVITGEEHPIILANVKSVLRLGPTGMERRDLWKTDSANTLAHSFQLVEVIGTSEWLNRTLSITTPGHTGSPQSVNSFECPDLGQMYAVLLPIRQLYAEDDAFNRACKVYLTHVQDERKHAWVKEMKRTFNKHLDSSSGPLTVQNHTVRQLLDLVMYGAGLVHYSKSARESVENFKQALENQPRERLAFAFIASCRFLYGFANNVHVVLRQDYEHWLSNLGCQQPDLVFLRDLFASRQPPADDSARPGAVGEYAKNQTATEMTIEMRPSLVRDRSSLK